MSSLLLTTLPPSYFEAAGHNGDTLLYSTDHQSRVSKQFLSFWGLLDPHTPPKVPPDPPYEPPPMR